VASGGTPVVAQPLPSVVIEAKGDAVEWLELWRFRDLFLILAERDMRVRYRQTGLGVMWVILQPLAAALIFAAIFGLFAKLPSDGSPYLLFIFAAMLPWSFVSSGVQRAGNSLVNNAGLVTKIYFPRPIIPIATIAAGLLDFGVAGIVMLALMVVSGAPFTWAIAAVPALTIVALAITLGAGLLFSSLTVYYRDFSYAMAFALQLWMYGSPVVYSSSLVPDQWRLIYGLNPMVGVVDGFRWALLGTPAPTTTLLESVGIASLMLVIGALVFKRVERSFADVI
jgi:lipopolysaccharide transport system permease protein